MTRAQAYAEGFQEGRRRAEFDVRDGYRSDISPGNARYFRSDQSRAEHYGLCRGYRDTIARWEAGTLTAQMLELAPVNR